MSIRRKQTLVMLLTSGLALLLACAGFFAYDVITFQEAMRQRISTLADALGINCAGALDFNDRKLATEVLSALRAEPHITAACIYTEQGEVFAKYPQQGPGANFIPPPPEPAGDRFERQRFVLFHPVTQGAETLGTLFIQSDLRALGDRLKQYAFIAGGVLLTALLVAFLLSTWFQRVISAPVLHLVRATRAVAQRKDYTVRVPKESADELGQLIDDFNEMLAQIQERDTALQQAQAQLEERVAERTRELSAEIAERKRVEGQLLQAQKMEAVGQLAGGIAHDFNNILAATILQLELVQDDPELTARLRAELKEVEKGAHKAADLTRQLLLFSRQQIMQVKPLDLNEVLTDLLKMLRRLLGEHIEVALLGEPGPLWVDADASMMQQVVMNLCVNARDAMPKGGRLMLDSRRVEISASTTLAYADARPGIFICLSVSDTGCGIDPRTLPHIFEPFFTTKEVGRGTGMGLATVYGIVKQHLGWIEVESKAGAGTTFRIYLPARLKAPDGKPVEPLPPVPLGQETILVVEDDLPVQKLVVASLKRLGYRVLAADNGAAALRCWNEHSDEIALLLTDMVMPQGMTGLELAERLRQLKPGLKVILSTGYSHDMARLNALKDRGMVLLTKPYEVRTLATTVRECLDQP
jgi:signal transduction histidine kinase